MRADVPNIVIYILMHTPLQPDCVSFRVRSLKLKTLPIAAYKLFKYSNGMLNCSCIFLKYT